MSVRIAFRSPPLDMCSFSRYSALLTGSFPSTFIERRQTFMKRREQYQTLHHAVFDIVPDSHSDRRPLHDAEVGDQNVTGGKSYASGRS